MGWLDSLLGSTSQDTPEHRPAPGRNVTDYGEAWGIKGYRGTPQGPESLPQKPDYYRQRTRSFYNTTTKAWEPVSFNDDSHATYIEPDDVRPYLEAITKAREAGYEMPEEATDPQFLTALLLQEGRTNFGTNEYNKNNKSARELVSLLSSPDERGGPSVFAAAMYDKGQVAKRLGIPLTTAWNGTGRSRDSHKTGQDYTDSFDNQLKAAMHPKNAALYNFIKTNLK